MKTKEFDFELPSELIAQYPLAERTDSRLLCYTRATKQIEHRRFTSLVEALLPGDVLVMNDSRVIPARLFGKKSTGGRVELLVERILPDKTFLSHIKASKGPRAGTKIELDGGWKLNVLAKQDDLYHCAVETGEAQPSDEDAVNAMLQAIGHVPLPPYIEREDKAPDVERYQTVYAKHKGSVAAPTAGLHFDDAILKKLRDRGVILAYVTLHVGAGTFRPVRAEQLSEHQMHTEYFQVDEALCETVLKAKSEKRRVIAVGTTALRSLESAARDGQLKPQSADTNIFIYPGYQFNVCDGLITNFHLPESTLLMLVAAFIGHAEVMALYQEAIAEQYRFFSYGDATLLL